MFEKETEEWFDQSEFKGTCSMVSEIFRLSATSIWQNGAEYGYNKANEWHYNGIPHDNKPYLCKVEQPTKYDESEYEILFFDDKDMSWFRWLTLWNGEEGNEIARINRKVIAWKEIVLPKESK